MTWRRLVVLVAGVLLVASLADAQAAIAHWREPRGSLRFVHSQFGVTPDPWQEETLLAFEDPRPEARRLSLQAAAGVGKSAVMSWCAWYFLGTQCSRVDGGIGFDHPKGFVTGITAQNLRDNFWAEMAKWQSRSAYLRGGFTWSAQRIFANDHAEDWFLAPRNWPKSGSADEQGRTLSGLHGANVAAFADESGAIPTTVLRAAEQMLSERGVRFGKLMQAGNPISLEGMLYAAANQLRSQWVIVVVTNDPDDPRCAPRGDKAWARQQIETYGRDNPWVLSYILGQFPPASLNALLGIEDVQAAMRRTLRADAYEHMQKRLGVDVARFGDDRTVIFPRQGLQAFRPVVLRQANTTDIAARVAMARMKWGAEVVLVDDTGHWGHGVIDQLTTAQVPALGIQFHGKAINVRYRNRRAEMWIEMAAWVKGGGSLPNVPELVAELTTPTYTFINGTFALEEKDQIKKRLGRSPDLADGLALTLCLPDMPADVLEQIKGEGAGARAALAADPYQAARIVGHPGLAGRALTEYDPYAGGHA